MGTADSMVNTNPFSPKKTAFKISANDARQQLTRALAQLNSEIDASATSEYVNTTQTHILTGTHKHRLTRTRTNTNSHIQARTTRTQARTNTDSRAQAQTQTHAHRHAQHTQTRTQHNHDRNARGVGGRKLWDTPAWVRSSSATQFEAHAASQPMCASTHTANKHPCEVVRRLNPSRRLIKPRLLETDRVLMTHRLCTEHEHDAKIQYKTTYSPQLRDTGGGVPSTVAQLNNIAHTVSLIHDYASEGWRSVVSTLQTMREF